MKYDDSNVRSGFISGATAAFDAMAVWLPAPQLREMGAWLDQLDEWTGGTVPPAPGAGKK